MVSDDDFLQEIDNPVVKTAEWQTEAGSLNFPDFFDFVDFSVLVVEQLVQQGESLQILEFG